MSPSWPRAFAAAAAAAALGWAGLASADIRNFNNVNDFKTLSDSQGGFPSQAFRSSDIVAPVFQINTLNAAEVDDAPYIFLGTVYGFMNAGPMILDARDLSLVYADQNYENAYFSNVQKIGDTPYLAFWEGYHSRGHANGFCLIFDQSYNLRYNVTAQGLGPALADMHEMAFTPDGNVVFSTYLNMPYDCSVVGGPVDGMLMDSGFQEIDPETNEVVFDWRALDHFDIADSFAPYGSGFGVADDSGWDFFHINSIEKTDDGNYLVSSRHLSTLALINGTDGSPIWQLGGKHNQFLDLSNGQATNIGWQHDARFYKDQTQITMFDNHGEYTGPCLDKCQTRGLHLEIDTAQMTARVVHEYYHPQRVDSGAMGGMQTLDSGNVMLGWGYNPSFVEYKADGTPVMDAQRGLMGDFLADMFAYRVSKHHWKGTPQWGPSIAVDHPEGSSRQGKVFVSWNGATEVSSWIVIAADDSSKIDSSDNIIAESARTGFETEIFLGAKHKYRYVAAAALDASRDVLGSTFIIDMMTGQPFFMMSQIKGVQPRPSAQEQEPDGTEGGQPSDGSAGDGDDQHKGYISYGDLGAMAGCLSVFGLASYGAVRLWQRRKRANAMSEEERGVYTKVGNYPP